MAIIFSKITLSADEHETQFFACGTVRESEDLDPYTLYHKFTEEISSATEINVHVDTHIYGDGERFDATPEEMAYFTIRDRDDPTFLPRCEKIGESDFSFTYCPEEKNKTLDGELTAMMNALYERTVPQKVQLFIEKKNRTDSGKPKPKSESKPF